MARHVMPIFLSAILFLVAIPASAQTSISGQLEFEAAKKLLSKENFTEASKQFDKLIQAGFSDPEIYKFRGIARFRLGEYSGAAQDLEKARRNDEDAQVNGMLGICRYLSQEFEAAKYFLKKAIDGGFNEPKGHLYLGYLYLDAFQYKEALHHLNEATNKGESEAKLFELRGIAAFYCQEFELSIKDLGRFLETEIGSLPDFEVLGMAYAEMDKPLNAFPFLTKADSLGSNNKKVYFHLGNSLCSKKMYMQAIEAYSKSIALKNNDPVVYMNRGNAKINTGLSKESIIDFDKAISLSPDKSIGYRSRAAAHMKLENWAGVITDITIANALGDVQSEDGALLAMAKFNIKNFQGALDDITMALSKGNQFYVVEGNKHSLYLLKGKCLLALKRHEEAVAAFNQAEKTGEGDVELNIQRARAWVGLNNYESALQDLAVAQQSSPKNATVFYNSAVIKEEMGDFGAAIVDYGNAIKLNPKDALAYFGRANCKARKGEMTDAITDMDEAVKLDDKNATYYKVRANFYYQMKIKDKACFDWRKAVEFGDEKARFFIDQYCNK